MLIIQRNNNWGQNETCTYSVLPSSYYISLKDNSALTNFRLLLIKD